MVEPIALSLISRLTLPLRRADSPVSDSDRTPEESSDVDDQGEMAEMFAYRATQWPLRIKYATAFVVAYGWFFGIEITIAWFLAYGTTQLVEMLLFRLRPKACVRFSIPILFTNSFVFGSLPIVALPIIGAMGTSIAAILSIGGLINAAFSSRSVRSAFFASTSPYFIFLFGLQIKVAQDGASNSIVIVQIVAIALLWTFVWSTWRRSAQTLNELQEARRASEEARAHAVSADTAKSAFVAMMSHEIRTPMNAILGMSQVISRDDMTPRGREHIAIIRENAETLMNILNDTLDISKINSGKMELHYSVFDLEEILSSVYLTFKATAETRKLDLVLEIGPEARGGYRGDESRIRQILQNLVSNAVKFTEKGVVTVRADRIADDLRLSVTDTGIGIDAPTCARLFQPFAQAHSGTARLFGGTGLGLSVSRQIAKLMGGDIVVQSTPGQGSTFTAILPLERVSEEARLTVPDDPIQSRAGVLNETLRVLVAEDNPTNQLVLRTILNQLGMHPVIVGDGLLALEAWKQQAWDLVLLDIQMPGMDGLSVAAEIRKCEATGARAKTPILALTADVMTHQIAQYAAVGIDGYVAKPIRIQDLVSTMTSALAPVSSEAELPYETERSTGTR